MSKKISRSKGRGEQRSEQDYQVGYRKPPIKSRFKSGQSGNPRGRPRGSKNLKTLLRDLAARRISVREDGKLRRMSLIEALLWLLARNGLQGDLRAVRMLLDAFANLEDDPQAGTPSPSLPEDDHKLLAEALQQLTCQNQTRTSGANNNLSRRDNQ